MTSKTGRRAGCVNAAQRSSGALKTNVSVGVQGGIVNDLQRLLQRCSQTEG